MLKIFILWISGPRIQAITDDSSNNEATEPVSGKQILSLHTCPLCNLVFQKVEQLFDHTLSFHIQNLPVDEIWHHWLQRNEKEAHKLAILLLDISILPTYANFLTQIDNILHKIIFCCDKCHVHRENLIRAINNASKQHAPNKFFQMFK